MMNKYRVWITFEEGMNSIVVTAESKDKAETIVCDDLTNEYFGGYPSGQIIDCEYIDVTDTNEESIEFYEGN